MGFGCEAAFMCRRMNACVTPISLAVFFGGANNHSVARLDQKAIRLSPR